MDYSGYSEFPFPSSLSEEERKIRDFFLNLDDGEQLKLLNKSSSYSSFHEIVVSRMNEKEAAAR